MRVLITGNIGSGKTTVCRLFETLGVPVYYADREAKRLMVESAELTAGIREAFGEESYLPDGSLNRKHLAAHAFGDPKKLAVLNALVHPAVAADGEAWHAEKIRHHPYTLYEAAIVLEIGQGGRYDKIVTVACPEPVRRRRVMARDEVTAADFDRRAANQWSDAEKEAAADHLIVNDGKRLLWPQVLGLHAIFGAKLQ